MHVLHHSRRKSKKRCVNNMKNHPALLFLPRVVQTHACNCLSSAITACLAGAPFPCCAGSRGEPFASADQRLCQLRHVLRAHHLLRPVGKKRNTTARHDATRRDATRRDAMGCGKKKSVAVEVNNVIRSLACAFEGTANGKDSFTVQRPVFEQTRQQVDRATTFESLKRSDNWRRPGGAAAYTRLGMTPLCR